MPAPTNGGSLPPGTQIGRYSLLARLAIGGMAELYVARHSGLQGFERTVVVKRILPHLTEDPEFIRMFLDEARISASLDHPNIAQVTDIDLADGEYFFAMEYVHGKNLRQFVKASGDLSIGIALRIVCHTAAGLHHAHEALGPDGRPLGLVHRDVSPSNIMVSFAGAVKLTDFGIAKASERTSRTLEGRIKGKVGYMSPEQCRGDETLDRRSDIFALGILLYEVTTGLRAFYSANDFATMARITRVEYTRPSEIDPDYPAQLERIIERALQKEPEARYQTAEDMRVDLEDYAHGAGVKLTETELSARMAETFGTPAHPQTLPAIEPREEPLPTVVPTLDRAQRRWLLPAVLGGSVLATGLAVFAASAAGGPEQESPAKAAPATAEPPALNEAVREPELEPPSPPDLPTPAVVAEVPPSPSERPAEDDAAPVAPRKATTAKRKRPKRPAKARPKPRSTPKKEPGDKTSRSPYPPGYEP